LAQDVESQNEEEEEGTKLTTLAIKTLPLPLLFITTLLI
jgi:hypothetical protein